MTLSLILACVTALNNISASFIKRFQNKISDNKMSQHQPLVKCQDNEYSMYI